MPTELEELVEFLHHGNTQIRQVAAENLVAYSITQPDLFRRNQLEPVTDLKLLVKDYTPIAKNAITMLINLTEHADIIKALIADQRFVEYIFLRITAVKSPTADLLAMLLANLVKNDDFALSLLTMTRDIPESLSTSPLAIDQLLDLFVKGAAGAYNALANHDYLCYLFADISRLEAGRKHFLTPRKEGVTPTTSNADTAPGPAAETVVPLSKLVVFTEHASDIRRRGVASTIKNCAFDVSSHPRLLLPNAFDGVHLLPYILLPLMGPEEYEDADADDMLEEVQLLGDDKKRERDVEIIKTHLETLLLLTTTREGRDRLREVKVYPIVRELHLQSEDEGVREACDRFVQVIMRDEEGEESEMPEPPKVLELEEDEDEDEENQLVEVA